MQFQEQIIHTPTLFFRGRDAVRLREAEPANRNANEARTLATDDVLVERNNFHVRLANTQERQSQVSTLINRMYSWRGYQLDANKPRYHPNRTTLQACRGKETLGTLTLNVDSGCGLFADDLYRGEINALRQRGGKVCELTGLAVGVRLDSAELLATLFHLMHILARRLHRATDAVIEINPRHLQYYERLLGFRQIGERKTCGRVKAPAVLLHIEADFVEEQIALRAGSRKRSGHSLYPYFFSSRETEHISRRIMEMKPRFLMTAHSFNRFLENREQL